MEGGVVADPRLSSHGSWYGQSCFPNYLVPAWVISKSSSASGRLRSAYRQAASNAKRPCTRMIEPSSAFRVMSTSDSPRRTISFELCQSILQSGHCFARGLSGRSQYGQGTASGSTLCGPSGCTAQTFAHTSEQPVRSRCVLIASIGGSSRSRATSLAGRSANSGMWLLHRGQKTPRSGLLFPDAIISSLVYDRGVVMAGPGSRKSRRDGPLGLRPSAIS